MRELQNPFRYKTMKKSRKTLGLMASSQVLLIALLGGCITKVRDSVQNLPEAIAQAGNNANDKGYPDLSKIPPMPTNMKTDADWLNHQKKLEAQRNEVDKAPNSRLPSANEADMSWSAPLKTIVETDPRFTPAPIDDNPTAWAARMRAIFETPKKTIEKSN